MVSQTASQKKRCVVSVRLSKKGLTSQAVQEDLHSFIVEETGFDAIVSRAQPLHDGWWDLLVDYSAKLLLVYERFFEHPLVQDVVTKPVGDFGHNTPATIK